jgi:ABC-2 type transport system ATP-binding protein
MAAIKVSGLSKAYGHVQAVRQVDLDVPAGQVLALLGPNGAGKTTTVEILTGFRHRDHGQVEVLGLDPARDGPRLRQRIGIVWQDSALDRYLSVTEMLALWTRYYPRPRSLADLLSIAGLEHKAKARVRELSGGQQRRLDLALALAGHPELIFLDEPTTGFDPSARRAAWTLIRRLADDGTTIVLTTHYLEEAQALADQVVVMTDGQIAAAGPPASLAAGQETVVHFRLAAAPSRPAKDASSPAADASGLPAPPELPGLRRLRGEPGAWELRTTRPTADLHALTGWALDRDIELNGLVVSRPTLEDVYLRLTAAPEPEAAAP